MAMASLRSMGKGSVPKLVRCLLSPHIHRCLPPTNFLFLPTTRALSLPGFLSRRNVRPRRRFRYGFLVGGASVILFMWSIRTYKESLVLELNNPLHPDRSKVSIEGASRQVAPTVEIITGAEKSTLVDQQKYSHFVQASVDALLEAQVQMEKEASKLLSEQLDSCFSVIHPRAEKFADWYFSYSTSFRLLQEATVSLARHGVSFLESVPVNEAVAADMDKFMTKKYERIVLRPELNNGALQTAYTSTVRDVHNRYREAVLGVEAGMLDLLTTETSHLEPPRARDIKLSLDWASQLHKIKTVPANFEKSPELTLLFSTAGAAVGKTLASKGAAIGTTKALAGKLTAPFVTKVVTAGGGAAVGSVAGPLGSIAGAMLGLGVDYTVNAGVELVKRDEFIRDVQQVLDATKQDYFNLLEQELHRAIRVWIEDAIQLLPRLGASGNATPLYEEGNGFMLSSWLVRTAGSFCYWPARN